MTTGRSKGYRISQSQRLKLAAKLRALLEKQPALSIEALVQRTGAPFAMCNFIRARVKEENAQRLQQQALTP